MTTRRQLERVIVHQAICEKAAHDQAEFFMRKLDDERHVGGELLRERSALIAENAELRADVEWLEAVVHDLVDDRYWKRYYLRAYDKTAHSRAIDMDKARRTISELRAKLKRKKGRKHATR